ncbi:MAG: GTP 3',8-cyclase MoaA [Firmicutes bacterium]|nr:GTP 3',8-cyclase MoaA [Bacillota bacterium]
MTDSFGRNIDYLRISVTERCNLNCVYCKPENKCESHDILTADEIVRICGIFAGLGITKIKITGGEPLLRDDICGILKKIRALPEIESLTLTTNGILFRDMADEILRCGVDSVNFSLDSPDEEGFCKITGNSGIADVYAGIRKALDLGFKSVKINFTAIRELNYDRIIPIARMAEKYPVWVRFIELMPMGSGRNFTPVYTDEVKKILGDEFGEPKRLDVSGNGPAKYCQYSDFAGKIGFISPLSECFCQECNKIRIASGGELILCLGHEKSVNIKELFEKNISDTEITKIIEEKIKEKPLNHNFFRKNLNETEMYHIGG